MHSLRFKALAFCSLLPLAVPTGAADDFRGIRLPIEIAGFQRGSIIDYEARKKGLGISVAYGGHNIKATVFIYDMEIENLPEGINNLTVQKQAQRAFQDILQAHPEAETLEPLSKGSGACATFLSAKVLYQGDPSRPNEPLYSHLYLGSRRGNFVKVRLTYAAKHAFATGVLFEARFAQALCRAANE